jgi:hypothetical protein
MYRPRLAPWVTLAAVAFSAGCQSCGCPNGNGGFFSRLCARRGTVVYDGPVVGTPVSTMPYNGGCCEGGPILSDPGVPGAGLMGPAINGGPPVMTTPPMTTLPPPAANTGPPPLAPVPGAPSPGFATPTPATPSSRGR